MDARARVCVRQNYYSVPARYAGRRLPVRLSATAVEVLDGPRVVARHERAAGKYAEVLVLDHYLEVLRRKPGALPGATALAQARAAGAFTAAHQRYWDAARRKHGDAAGTRALIEVLLAHRALPAAALTAAMAAAVSSRRLGPAGGRDRGPPPGWRAGRTGDRDRRAGPLRPPGPGPGRLRPAADREQRMNPVSDTAAQAAIGAAARELRLPTVRAQAARLAEIAAREHAHPPGLPRRGPVRRARRPLRPPPRPPHRRSPLPAPQAARRLQHRCRPGDHPRPPGAAWRPALTWTTANPSSCSATAAPARPTCSSGSAWPPASKAAGSATSPPPSSSTSSSKPPMTAPCPAWSAAMAASTSCCLDELGYVQIDPRGAELLFQVITEREERASIAIGTNLPFSEWGTVFPDPRLVAAIVDRVTFNAHILETGTQSYRLRTTKTTSRTKNPS